MVEIILKGRWKAGSVRTHWAPTLFAPPADVQRIIDAEWDKQKSLLGEKLFDGPMCRLESLRLDGATLELGLSRISYRSFVGSNLHHAYLADLHGETALANPVGVSCALLSADGFLLLGRRNERVAYYPGRVHPFAGTLEPDGDGLPDVFDEVQRELREELALRPDEVTGLVCTGIAQDPKLRQPELMFIGWTRLERREIESSLDPIEHASVVAIPSSAEGLARAVESIEEMTPVAVAAVLLCGREIAGEQWFGSMRQFYQDRSGR